MHASILQPVGVLWCVCGEWNWLVCVAELHLILTSRVFLSQAWPRQGQRPRWTVEGQGPGSRPRQRQGREVIWGAQQPSCVQRRLPEANPPTAANQPLHQPAPHATLLWDPQEEAAATCLGVQRELHRHPDAEPVFCAGGRDGLWKDHTGRKAEGLAVPACKNTLLLWLDWNVSNKIKIWNSQIKLV